MYLEIYERLNRERLSWRTEEEVRLGWLYALRDALNIIFQAERGRSDASYNQVIIEFKNNGFFRSSSTSPKFIEALEELTRYINAKAALDGLTPQEYIGIAIDGVSIAFAYIPTTGGDIVHGPIMPLSVESVAMVFEMCKQSQRRALTADNLIEDFGHGSEHGRSLMQALAEALFVYLESAETNKIKMLYMEWKSLYGQVATLSSAQVENIIQTIGFVYQGNSPDKLSKVLFVLHTFDSLLIKLLAAEIVSQITQLTAYSDFAQNALIATNDRLIDMLDCDIEHSQLYERTHIHGFVEEPLFSWYIDVCRDDNVAPTITKNIIISIREILIQLTLYRMQDLVHAQTNDVLKRFYQNIVPRALRKSLGEFYTPDWLVEVSLDKVNRPFESTRFLDPTCGSGSFLLAIINRIRNETDLPANQLLPKITNSVWGFDLNPLAVQTSRVNYLIAISDLLLEAPGIDIEIPVLLADAIYAPAPDPDGDNQIVNYVIGSNIANLTISLPTELAQNRTRLDKAFSVMEECIETDAKATDMLRAMVEKRIIQQEEATEWGSILSTTYERVLDLHRRQWNGIWFRIVRNYFWSATAGQFDFVIGNPPWVRWSKLPELYRERVMPTCRRYDIFSNTPFYGGNELDISGLITYTVADKWLKESGYLIFLLTQTHFQSASSEGFRRFNIDKSMYLKPICVEDLKLLRPFPDAANKTVIFMAQKTTDTPSYPVEYSVWDTVAGRSRAIPEYASKQEVLLGITREINEANPVESSSSPWVILPRGEFRIVNKLAGRCTWTEGRKGVTCDLNGLYFVNIVNVSHDGNLVQIETRPEAGRTDLGPKQRFWVEPDVLYPVIKGAGDLVACGFKPQHELCAIVPNAGITAEYLLQTRLHIERQNPNLFNYFRTFEQQLKRRSTYRTRMKDAPFYSVYNVGDYTFSPWKVVWPEQPGKDRIPVAVVNTRSLPGIGRKVVIPDHKIYFAEFQEPTPAYFLCGLLLCNRIQRFIKSFHIMLQVGDVFKHMRLPEFIATDRMHIQLAELVANAHNEEEPEAKQRLLQEISMVANCIIDHWLV